MITPLALQANIHNAIRLLVVELNETSTWEVIASRASGRFATTLMPQLHDVPDTEEAHILTNLLVGLGMPGLKAPHTDIALATALAAAQRYLASLA